MVEQALARGHEVCAVVRSRGPARGGVRAGFLGRDKMGSSITGADIATFLLDQLDGTRFIRAAPAISN